jgi:hypothetical protein
MPRRVRDVCARSAKEHADVEVLAVTHRGRVLRVPRECTLGEVVRAVAPAGRQQRGAGRGPAAREAQEGV